MALLVTMQRHLISKEIDNDLINFSHSLSPPKELLKKWNSSLNKLIQDVRKTIQRKFKYRIDRYRVGGSVSKKTAIIEPEYDCVLFFNDVNPRSFETVIQQLVDILTPMSSISGIITTRYSVGFIFCNEVKVDLLPATNLVERGGNFTGQEVIDNQRENVLRTLQKELGMYYSYSSSVSESQVVFMKYQSSLVHVVVKLTKFWYKALCCDYRINIPGFKYLIELIAVYCAQKEEEISSEEGRSFSVTQALARIFEKLSDTKNLAIKFRVEDGVGMSPIQARRSVNKRSVRRGFVIDPANPHNDILEGVKKMCEIRQNGTAISLVEQIAKQSLLNLRSYLVEYHRDDSLSSSSDDEESDLQNEWLDVIFVTDICNRIKSSKLYKFALCFTYFENYAEYVNQVIPYENIKYTGVTNIAFIKNMFRIGVAIEAFKHDFRDDGDDESDDDDYEEDEEDEEYGDDDNDNDSCTSSQMYETVFGKLDNLQDAIVKYMDAVTNLEHLETLQARFHPWGTQFEGPSVRSHAHGHSSFTEKLQNVRDKHKNVFVLHAPVGREYCIREDREDNVLYCCFLIVVD